MTIWRMLVTIGGSGLRSLVVIAGIVSIGTGCGFYWDLRQPIETGCADLSSYFLDEDGDGWGAAGTDILLCGGNAESGHTARNGLDCDDSVADVTGRIGSICPSSLVTGGASYDAVVYGASEFVAVTGETALVWSTEAEVACGPWGWGGSLATFDGADDLAAVQNALDAQDIYAGFVDLRWDTTTSTWGWADGSGLDPNAVGWCLGSTPDPFTFDPYLDPKADDFEAQVAQLRVALVRREQGWCFGEPRQAIPVGLDTAEASDYPPYGTKEGHFVCERAAPDPSAWAP